MSEAVAATRLLCHRCSHFLGEAHVPLVMVGLVKEQEVLRTISRPRDVRKCPGCGWFNVFKPPGA